MGALEIDAFTRRVCCQEHLDLGIVLEGLLRLHPVLTPYATMDDDDGLLAAQEGGDALLQVVQRVAVFGEDHELLAR